MSTRQLVLLGVLLSTLSTTVQAVPRGGGSPRVVVDRVDRPERAERPGASRASGDFGMGFTVGEPAGLALKKWTSRSTAFDAGLAYSFSEYVELFADHLWHFPKAGGAIVGASLGQALVPYVGVGIEVFFDTSNRPSVFRRGGTPSDAGFGGRVPLGVEYLPRAASYGFYGELVPGMALAPSVFAFLEGGVGARFYF